MINFRNYPQLTKVVIPNAINLKNNNFSNAFKHLSNLVSVDLHNGVSNISYGFYNCINLTTAVCGPNVTNLSYAYDNCANLTTAACGPNVIYMNNTYSNCTNLRAAVCGSNVIDMVNTYYNCINLTTAVCGPNVTDMQQAYGDCKNLTTAVCGPNVINMKYTYSNCTNIQGNTYFYSKYIQSCERCFGSRSLSNRLNIYVHANTTTNTTVHRENYKSLEGNLITWTNAGDYQYNTYYNIYIYPVANVEEARIANGDPDYMGVI